MGRKEAQQNTRCVMTIISIIQDTRVKKAVIRNSLFPCKTETEINQPEHEFEYEWDPIPHGIGALLKPGYD
jgi:hypothetical protein